MDAVELVRGPEREDAMFRCNDCGTLQLHPELIPTGGSTCVECSASIRVSDRVEFAGLTVRILAFVLDVMLFTIPYLLFAVVAFAFSSELSHDEQGDLTDGAVLLMRVLSLTLVAAYVVMYELSNPSVGKRAFGLRVVRTTDGHPPSVPQRLVRLCAQSTNGCDVRIWLRSDDVRCPASYAP